ncbi:hypothetical protein Pint_29496 [Pistacia integerrima]|uniref:Uncharacterized protein n=1 Tax=Pistacia integerrima TaxID=434235 RepID=A0ACC0X1T8_9ROSI|nr:hypothetical protein Pint_29496 [Pistacia integerrima]
MVLGKGGFGTVYHGYLDDTQVAVKMLSPSSVQGYKQFQAEVELLMRVHHKNLTALVGYCDEGINMGLIYEFMANGNLKQHLLATFEDAGDDGELLSWEGRLKIATEAAQCAGLEYLHSGCKPPIVHRDVKSTNILLNENFQAKLSDFGLSRIFPTESGTHVSTTIAGPLDTLTLMKYLSFTIYYMALQWVSFMLSKADIRNIVDPRLQGDFDINSVWKAVEIAMACISPTLSKRPTMTQLVIELNKCLAIEIARKKVGNETESKDESQPFLSQPEGQQQTIHSCLSRSANHPFGTVYHGRLDDNQVAVKMFSPSSVQGHKQFQAEVEILMRVHS